MSDDNNIPNPFGGLPFFNDMMKAMAGQGPLNWELAQQFAQIGAAGDTSDPEPDASTLMEAAMAERRRPTGGGFMMNSEECTADRSAGWMGSGLDECVLKSSVLTRGKH